MFRIFADDLCFFDDCNPEDEFKLVSPKLSFSDNSAGSLTFTLPPCNCAYYRIELLSTYIYVYRDSQEIWSGRAIDENKDFWNNRTITCEGRLAFLNDTVQPKWKYSTSLKTLSGFLQHLIDVHNGKVDNAKKFVLGTISSSQNLSGKWSTIVSAEPDDSDLICTDYETTFDCIRKKIVEQIGGHIRVVKNANNQYQIDYLADTDDGSVDAINASNQKIEFGNNLFDFAKSYDMTSLVTVVIPLGDRLEDADGKQTDNRLMIDSVSIEAESQVLSKYGRIEKAVVFDGVTDKNKLESLGREYLKSALFDSLTLEVKAVDLHCLNPDLDSFNLYDSVYCISVPHGLTDDKAFVITKIDIPLDDPASTTYTLGRSERQSLSSASSTSNSNVNTRINNAAADAISYANQILALARQNAASLMDTHSTGFVTFKTDSNGNPEEIYIADNRDYTKADRFWRWNINGLAYYNKNDSSTYRTSSGVTGYSNKAYTNHQNQSFYPKLAMTMDGGFCADFITSGTIAAGLIEAHTISANDIEAGILRSQNFNGSFYSDGSFSSRPTAGSFFNLNNGHFGVYGSSMGADITTGRFRVLWDGNELGGFGTESGPCPRIFCNPSNELHIGFGVNNSNDGNAAVIKKHEIWFLTNNQNRVKISDYKVELLNGVVLDGYARTSDISMSNCSSPNDWYNSNSSGGYAYDYNRIWSAINSKTDDSTFVSWRDGTYSSDWNSIWNRFSSHWDTIVDLSRRISALGG